MLAYVINRHGKPLMPCHPAKARLLLKQGKAKVIKRTPFTIQLIYGLFWCSLVFILAYRVLQRHIWAGISLCGDFLPFLCGSELLERTGRSNLYS